MTTETGRRSGGTLNRVQAFVVGKETARASPGVLLPCRRFSLSWGVACCIEGSNFPFGRIPSGRAGSGASGRQNIASSIIGDGRQLLRKLPFNRPITRLIAGFSRTAAQHAYWPLKQN